MISQWDEPDEKQVGRRTELHPRLTDRNTGQYLYRLLYDHHHLCTLLTIANSHYHTFIASYILTLKMVASIWDSWNTSSRGNTVLLRQIYTITRRHADINGSRNIAKLAYARKNKYYKVEKPNHVIQMSIPKSIVLLTLRNVRDLNGLESSSGRF